MKGVVVSYTKIGQLDVEPKIRKMFVDFLDKHGVSHSRFFQMHESKRDSNGKPYTIETVSELIKKTRFELFVSMSSWSHSTEGMSYWGKISDDWEREFESIAEEHQEFFEREAEMIPRRFFYKVKGVVKPREVEEV
jgi:hypothetical protein